MPAISASAPGKVILFGEHAVVYNRPAIAVPVLQVQAKAMVMADLRAPSGQISIQSPQIDLDTTLDAVPQDHPIAQAFSLIIDALKIQRMPALQLRIVSSIPVAAGLGSGAAVSIAIIRAVSTFLGHPMNDEQVSALAYEVEKLHHGTPSGIDNTVITYQKPVYFIRDSRIEVFRVSEPFTIVIGDTGIKSPTALAVSEVRRSWQAASDQYEMLFDEIGQLVQEARQEIEKGNPSAIGSLMNENHRLLSKMGVSSPELERLVEAARSAGALGAKLSGGGRGGNMIALASGENAQAISAALLSAGAVRTIISIVE
jgi:mevalonate kinase